MLRNSKSHRQYEARFRRVISYIHDHLDDELDLTVLAEVACLSPYHWHRIYSVMQGETIIDTVRRLRLQRAAAALVHTDGTISGIARAAGYASVPPFARAFRAAYGQPPGHYRVAGRDGAKTHSKPAGTTAMHDVRFVELPTRRLATIPHKGSYLNIGRAFSALGGTLAARGWNSPATQMLALFYDAPDSVTEAELRSCAAVIVAEDYPMESPLVEIRMPALRAAVLRHKGPYAELRSSYDWFYGQWLPGSGEEPADQPPFEHYLNTPMDTAPPDLLTDIHMPIKAH